MKRLPTWMRSPTVATALVFVVLYASASLAYPGFCSWFGFTSMFAENASLGMAAIGMTFVIISGGIDLSVGAVIALASIFLAKCLVVWHMPVVPAVLLVMALGAGFGAGMGAIIRCFRLPPFLVTLAGMFLARGVALALTPQKRLEIRGVPAFDALVRFGIVDFNLPAIVFMITMAGAMVLASMTRFGRNIYAIGGSESSAMLMGLPIGSTTIRIYALSGLCAAIGGIIHAVGTQAGDASAAYLMELDAIAAVVIGGTLLSGGVGHVAGTLLGVLILGVITTIPNYQGNLNTWWTKIAIGGFLLMFILLQRLLERSTRAT
ncbi:MAG: sugar ABC transporter permease YjfF [Planctomycetes bacterium]|nr:sugar ABC transporter permease YjfF [Planctomycetota bacterium]